MTLQVGWWKSPEPFGSTACAGPGWRGPAGCGGSTEGSRAGGWVVQHRAWQRPSTSAAYGEPGTWGCQWGLAPRKGAFSPCFARGNAGAVGRERRGCAWLRVLALGTSAGERVRKERER